MAFNISVDATDLDNGTDRIMFGQPVNNRTTSGVHTIRASFHIEADTTAALQTLWQATKTAFQTKDKRVILNYDDTAGDPIEDIQQGLDGYTNIITSVSQVEGDASTAFSMECVLDVVAIFDEEDGVTGQVGEISTTKFFTAGKVEARTVTAAFKNSDDGLTTGAANYAASRATLLTTYLGTDADGGRDGTTGLALTGENVRALYEDDLLVLVTLNSEEVVVDFSSEAALRSSELSISTSQPDAWPETDAGEIPTVVTVAGSATVDKDQLSGSLHAVWDKIRSNVESQIKSQTNLGDIELMSLSLNSDRKASTLSFGAAYRADNNDIFSYRRVGRESEQPQFNITIDAEGVEVVQKRPGENPLTRTITINRTGVGFVDLDPGFEGVQFGPGIALGNYILIHKDAAEEGPIAQGEVSNIFIQQATYVYRRFALETDVDIVKVGI